MRQARFATIVAIQAKALLNFKSVLPLATALLLPAAMPAAGETIDIAIGH